MLPSVIIQRRLSRTEFDVRVKHFVCLTWQTIIILILQFEHGVTCASNNHIKVVGPDNVHRYKKQTPLVMRSMKMFRCNKPVNHGELENMLILS